MKRRLRSTLLYIVASLFLFSTAVTLSWFIPENSIIGSTLTGSVLKAYFHCGDGSEENPFVITRPRQYENMIKLHYEMDGFWNGGGVDADGNPIGYYFEIGYKGLNPDEPDEYYVYNYDENGSLILDEEGNVSYSKTLYIGRDIKLPPLGDAEEPFVAKLEGNNMTVANFIVSAKGYNDIGIFGYVGPNGECHNTYFKDFVIDTDGYDSLVATPSTSTHTTRDHHGDAHVGYIAGHISYADSFTDVYVNKCEFRGRANNSGPITNNFGYYGLVENDAFGATVGTGDNYKFTLDAQAVYNFYSNNYDTIKNDTLVLKNTKETYYSTPDENGNKIARFPDKKISDTTTYYEDELFPTYNLQGDLWDPQDLDMNYSLSTLGYVDAPFYDETSQYHLYYKDGNRYIIPPESTVVTDVPLEQNKHGENNELERNFFYLDTSKATETRDGEWTYYYARNREIDEDNDRVSPSFTLPKIEGFRETGIISVRNVTGTVEVYVDETTISSSNLTFKKNGLLIPDYDITIPTITAKDIPYGIHGVSAKVTINAEYRNYTNTYYYYYGDIQSNGSVDQINYTIRANNIYSLSYSESKSETNRTMNLNEYVSDSTAYVGSDSTQYELYAKLLDENGNETGGYVKLYQKRTSFSYDGTQWTALQIKRVPMPGDDNNHFISDSTELVNSGYSSENIDIVGHMEFYYVSILGFINIKVIRMLHDNEDDHYKVQRLPTSKITNKSVFYAPQYAPGAIVLYLKNTADAMDNRDDPMGKIDFRYVNLRGMPNFTKGNGNYLALNSFDNSEQADVGLIESTIHAELLESDVKKVSYCCLDKDKRIIGTYDKNGNPETFSAPQSEIATYVLLLVCKTSGLGSDAWVARVDFEYKAEKGAGGSFGSVGYRDYPDRIEHTIFNFYISIPAGNANFSITVEYIVVSDGKNRYVFTVQTNTTVFVQTHLYDTTNYYISLNGDEITTRTVGVDIASTGYTYSAP